MNYQRTCLNPLTISRIVLMILLQFLMLFIFFESHQQLNLVPHHPSYHQVDLDQFDHHTCSQYLSNQADTADWLPIFFSKIFCTQRLTRLLLLDDCGTMLTTTASAKNIASGCKMVMVQFLSISLSATIWTISISSLTFQISTFNSFWATSVSGSLAFSSYVSLISQYQEPHDRSHLD